MFKSRWKWLVAFFGAEALLGYALCALLMCTSFSDILSVPRDLVRPSYAVPVGGSLICLIALQFAFLTPVAFPVLKSDARPGWARLLVSGFAVTLMVLTPPVYCAAVLANFFGWSPQDPLVRWLARDNPSAALAGAALVIGPVVTLALRKRWSAGIPIRQSVWIAGLVAGMLIAGFVMLIHSAVEVLSQYRWVAPTTLDTFDQSVLKTVLFSMPLVGWAVATPLLVRFAKKHPGDTALDKLSMYLLKGTIIEIAAIIPFDVLTRRKVDCYCFASSFFALIAAASAGFIVLGPAIFLVVGRRRAKSFGSLCPVCEYDMSGYPHALRCPECGAGWKNPGKSEVA